MTTNIRFSSVSNLTVDNDVMNLRWSHSLPDGPPGGATWLITGYSANESLRFVLAVVFSAIQEKFPEYNLWLLVGNSAWQPDTKIVRYYKLWGALAARGIKISHGMCSQEVMVEYGGKLKFFGAVKISELSIGSVANALSQERCAYLAALPSHVSPEMIITDGWSGDLEEDFKLISYAMKEKGLVLRRVGEFDDVEKGLIAVGETALIERLAEHSEAQ